MQHRQRGSGTAGFPAIGPVPFLPAWDRNVSLGKEHQMPFNHEAISMSMKIYTKEYCMGKCLGPQSLFLSHWARSGLPTLGLLSK